MSRQVIGYVVRARLKTGEAREYPFPGTGWETIRAAQDKERELLDAGASPVYLDAVSADGLPPPKPQSQSTRHQREIA